jgi:hypothetical protein
MMKGQVNPNIYPIIGSCIEDGLPPYIIYPDATGGNLKKFLLQCRLSDTGSHCVSMILNRDKTVIQYSPSYKATLSAVDKLHNKRGGFSWERQFISILLCQRVWGSLMGGALCERYYCSIIIIYKKSKGGLCVNF